MHNFFYFLLRHTNFFVFLLLEGLCALLIFNFNDYHRASFFTSANFVSGSFNKALSGVNKYFDLVDANEALVEQNNRLLAENELLMRQLRGVTDSVALVRIDSIAHFDQPNYLFYKAHVIQSSTNKARNMLTLDVGSNDGIQQDMAVFNSDGVIGLVSSVSSHYALVLPIINTSSHLSVKNKRSNHRGQLLWDGLSVRNAKVSDIPEHAEIEIGDTIVTSGASSFFPEGIPVGYVSSIEPDRNGGFYNIEIDLAVDFNSIYAVQLLKDARKEERETLENSSADE